MRVSMYQTGTFLNEFECPLLELFAGERFGDRGERDNLLLLLLLNRLLAFGIASHGQLPTEIKSGGSKQGL